MKYSLIKLLVLLFCLALVACSPAITTKKVVENAKSIQTLDIVIFMGDISLAGVSADIVDDYQNNLKEALIQHLPKILDKNNIPVLAIFADAGKTDRNVLEQSFNILNSSKSSHSLTLNAHYLRDKSVVLFDAALRDNSTKQIVWTAKKVQMPTKAKSQQKNVNLLAWGLLIGLERNGLISFANGSPVDEDGKPF